MAKKGEKMLAVSLGLTIKNNREPGITSENWKIGYTAKLTVAAMLVAVCQHILDMFLVFTPEEEVIAGARKAAEVLAKLEIR